MEMYINTHMGEETKFWQDALLTLFYIMVHVYIVHLIWPSGSASYVFLKT